MPLVNPHTDTQAGRDAQNDVWENGLKTKVDPEVEQEKRNTRSRRQKRRAFLKQQEQEELQPVEQHSPTQIHVPAWKTIIIGGSGGIRVRGVYRD